MVPHRIVEYRLAACHIACRRLRDLMIFAQDPAEQPVFPFINLRVLDQRLDCVQLSDMDPRPTFRNTT
jgi:hypothetical protein